MSDKVPTAKIYVWKDATLGEPGKPWKIGVIGWGEVLVIIQDCLTFAEAWQYVYDNYRRD